MQVNNVSGVSFQAHVPSRLKNKLFNTANDFGHEKAFAYLDHLKKVETWGQDTSTITELKPDGNNCLLSLVNAYLVPFKRVELPQKQNLLDTFMSLTEKDIINAEHSLKI